MGAIGSFFLSFFYPNLYSWAAHERQGLGLTYVFAVHVIIFTLILVGIHFLNAQLLDILMMSQTGMMYGGALQSVGLYTSDKILFFALSIVLWSFFFTVSSTSFIVLYAIYGQIFNLVFSVGLDFVAMCRIAAYAMIPASIISGVVFFVLSYQGIVLNNMASFLTIFAVYTFYIMFAAISCKYGKDFKPKLGKIRS